MYGCFPRLLQQSSSAGSFYINSASQERVEEVNKHFDLKLAVGYPIRCALFTAQRSPAKHLAQVNKKNGVSMGWTKYGGLEKA